MSAYINYKECFKGHFGEEFKFIGRVNRYSVDKEGYQVTLLSPLYAEIDGKMRYVGHTWVRRSDSFSPRKDTIIEFVGTTYSYMRSCRIEGIGVAPVTITYIAPYKDYYKGLHMNFASCDGETSRERKNLNENMSIIAAFENGVKIKDNLTPLRCIDDQLKSMHKMCSKPHTFEAMWGF